jgi:hypothetical protein
LLDADTFERFAELESPDGLQLGCLSFSRDSSRLAAGTSLQSVVHEWDLGRIRAELAKLGLDWPAPHPSPEPIQHNGDGQLPLSVYVDYGDVPPTGIDKSPGSQATEPAHQGEPQQP